MRSSMGPRFYVLSDLALGNQFVSQAVRVMGTLDQGGQVGSIGRAPAR